MKTLAEQMAVYAAYHQHPWNRLSHFVGVPLIIFSLLVALGWIRWSMQGVEISLAIVFVCIVLLYYLLLDVALALAMVLLIALLLVFSEWMAVNLNWKQAMAVFLTCFVTGWICQLVGHMYEGRRPGLVDNFWRVFVAPIFLMAEVFFALGFRCELQKEVADSIKTADTSRTSVGS